MLRENTPQPGRAKNVAKRVLAVVLAVEGERSTVILQFRLMASLPVEKVAIRGRLPAHRRRHPSDLQSFQRSVMVTLRGSPQYTPW
ncbi:hypothetical protein [Stenotrophomonas lacuserhaii]|uniref:hypothetical protein n=1 Tax=Stenotrophomonas lacuserhaii TaxID=2760084 RepID=UPI0032EE1B13